MPVDEKPSVMMREEEGVGAGKEVGGAQCCCWCRSGQGAAGARCKPWKHHGAAAVVAGTDVTGDRGSSKHGGASIKNKAKQLKQCIRWAAADAVGKSHRSELQCNTSASNASDGASKSHLSVKCNTWQWHGGNTVASTDAMMAMSGRKGSVMSDGWRFNF